MAVNWSELQRDLFCEILNRLELVDFIRFGAVCTSYRSIHAMFRTSCRPKPQLPWLLLSSPEKPDSRFLYSLTETDQNKNRCYEIHLPQISGFHFVGSCNGFLFAVDQLTQIHALNPITGTHFPLPPPTAHSLVTGIKRDTSGNITHYNVVARAPLDLVDMRMFYHKVIISPSLDTVVVIHGFIDEDLAFARVGDNMWTDLCADSPFDDIIFHKGCLHAVDFNGTLFVFDRDLNPSAPPFVSPEGPLVDESSGPKRFLVESPDGTDLFLIHRILYETEDGCEESRTASFKVYKLNEKSFLWEKVECLGDFAVFVGFNYTMSFSVRDFPLLRSNAVYFANGYKECCYGEEKPNRDAFDDQGIFSLEDGCIQRFDFTDDLKQFIWPPPIWFLPRIL